MTEETVSLRNGSEYPKILATREGASMASTWTEYLRLSKTGPRAALLQVCMYEALAEAPEPEDDDHEPEIPREIDGKKVVSVDDGWIVGGELSALDGRWFLFQSGEVEAAVEWLKGERWEVTRDIHEELIRAVSPDFQRLRSRPRRES
jgi:hypothetical protein